MTNQPLKQWISEAGIKKHITFHCFRHSYAVIQISLGTDIYTVSKMLMYRQHKFMLVRPEWSLNKCFFSKKLGLGSI